MEVFNLIIAIGLLVVTGAMVSAAIVWFLNILVRHSRDIDNESASDESK